MIEAERSIDHHYTACACGFRAGIPASQKVYKLYKYHYTSLDLYCNKSIRNTFVLHTQHQYSPLIPREIY